MASTAPQLPSIFKLKLREKSWLIVQLYGIRNIFTGVLWVAAWNEIKWNLLSCCVDLRFHESMEFWVLFFMPNGALINSTTGDKCVSRGAPEEERIQAKFNYCVGHGVIANVGWESVPLLAFGECWSLELELVSGILLRLSSQIFCSSTSST